ncbi:hypothetical protein HK414_15975 [Ramlibacter terrae]|uniref:Uncharacterized protein n=1 Tax=Ramlibacter terrae TaxID=2732511 RepID=A0ABX6P3K0_9BURK|nr:hypothetical protein HK414_15975 [Ramlibacter terrae]
MVPTVELDQSSADLYGYEIYVNGQTTRTVTATPLVVEGGTPLFPATPTMAGTGRELEIRYTATGFDFDENGVTTVTKNTTFSDGGAVAAVTSTITRQAGTSATRWTSCASAPSRWPPAPGSRSSSIPARRTPCTSARTSAARRSQPTGRRSRRPRVQGERRHARPGHGRRQQRRTAPDLHGARRQHGVHAEQRGRADGHHRRHRRRLRLERLDADGLAGTTSKQVSDIEFRVGSLSGAASYTVVVNGHAYTARAGDNALISVLNAGDKTVSFDAFTGAPRATTPSTPRTCRAPTTRGRSRSPRRSPMRRRTRSPSPATRPSR